MLEMGDRAFCKNKTFKLALGSRHMRILLDYIRP